MEPAAPSSEQRGLQKQWVQGARGDTEMFKGKPSDNVKAPLGQLDTESGDARKRKSWGYQLECSQCTDRFKDGVRMRTPGKGADEEKSPSPSPCSIWKPSRGTQGRKSEEAQLSGEEENQGSAGLWMQRKDSIQGQSCLCQ